MNNTEIKLTKKELETLRLLVYYYEKKNDGAYNAGAPMIMKKLENLGLSFYAKGKYFPSTEGIRYIKS